MKFLSVSQVNNHHPLKNNLHNQSILYKNLAFIIYTVFYAVNIVFE